MSGYGMNGSGGGVGVNGNGSNEAVEEIVIAQSEFAKYFKMVKVI